MSSFAPVNAESAHALPPIRMLLSNLDAQRPQEWMDSPTSGGDIGANSSSDESCPSANETRVKSSVKNKRAKEDRDRLASQIQAQEDALRYFIGYEPSRLQTKGNGKTSGLQGDKEEVITMSTHLLCAFLAHFKKHAEQSGFQAQLDAFYANAITSVKAHLENQKAAGARRAILPPDNIMSAVDGSSEECFGKKIGGTTTCGAHYASAKASNLAEPFDWRTCRYACRKEIMDSKFSVEADAADVDVSMADSEVLNYFGQKLARSRL